MMIVHTNDDSIENVHITVYHMCDLITSHRSNRWLKWIGMMWWIVCITQWHIITHMISFITSVICNHISVIFITMSTQRLFIKQSIQSICFLSSFQHSFHSFELLSNLIYHLSSEHIELSFHYRTFKDYHLQQRRFLCYPIQKGLPN